jgi:hypothetical protein
MFIHLQYLIITFYKSLIMLYVVILISDLLSTADFKLLNRVIFVSLFQNAAADFSHKSVSITRCKGQDKEQTNSRLDLRHT